MKYFLQAAMLLLLDLASTIFFLIVFSLTHNVRLAVGLGMALGLAQIGIQFARGRPIATMVWLSLFLVIAYRLRLRRSAIFELTADECCSCGLRAKTCCRSRRFYPTGQSLPSRLHPVCPR